MENKKITDLINSVDDLRALPEDDLPGLAEEIRGIIVKQVAENGGHLASNLGAVELTIALHRVFNTPDDILIWDVGHQTYTHKMLTGRRDRFSTLRKPGGLSGFTLREESEFDPFGAGHSSTSLSAALGFATAAKLDKSEKYTIAVLGDGAYTGGLIHEALNNIDKDLRLILVLNDNKMSISESRGGFAKHLTNIRTTSGYHKTKKRTRNFLLRIPLIGVPMFRAARRIKKSFKNLLFESNYFEDIGLYYLGPVDGHDVKKLTSVLGAAKDYKGACIVHVKTTKGKGYAPAELDPEKYHGVRPAGAPTGAVSFSEKMGELLVKKGAADSDICVITAAMSDGCGVTGFEKQYPDRFFDVGIAEEHAAVFAAGLAAAGKKPVFAVYSTFLQRSYDNLLHDIALQSLPVITCIDRAGFASCDGPTHNGIFDVAMLCQLPNVTLYAPIDPRSLENCLDRALASDMPTFIRYPAICDTADIPKRLRRHGQTDLYRSYGENERPDCLILTYGRTVNAAFAAADALAGQGVSCGVLLALKLLPLAETAEALLSALSENDAPVIVLEEGIRNGGFGECLHEMIRCDGRFNDRKLTIYAVDDPFARPSAGQSIMQLHHLTPEDLVAGAIALTCKGN